MGKEIKRPSAAQIKEWKKEHGSITAVETTDGEMIIVRQPRLAEMEKAIATVSAKPANARKPFDLQRAILPTIKLYEDPKMLEDEGNQLFVFNKLDEVVKFKEGTVKEL